MGGFDAQIFSVTAAAWQLRLYLPAGTSQVVP